MCCCSLKLGCKETSDGHDKVPSEEEEKEAEEEACIDPVCDGECKGLDNNGQEGGDGSLHLSPIDMPCLSNHHRANEDENRGGGYFW